LEDGVQGGRIFEGGEVARVFIAHVFGLNLTRLFFLIRIGSMQMDINAVTVQTRLKAWAEITSLCLILLEASLKKEFPNLPEKKLRLKLIERLNLFRAVRFSQE
jgi:hypothetical protein